MRYQMNKNLNLLRKEMTSRSTVSIKRMLFDPGTSQTEKITKKLIGSFLILFSTAILFTDKFTTFGITSNYGYSNVETFIWMVCQSLSPILLCIGSMMKPFKIIFFVPIYIFFIQLYWVFDYEMAVDDPILHLYAIGFCLGASLFLVLSIAISKFILIQNRILIGNIKKSVRHISIYINEKYINKLPETDQKNYTSDTVDYLDSLK